MSDGEPERDHLEWPLPPTVTQRRRVRWAFGIGVPLTAAAVLGLVIWGWSGELLGRGCADGFESLREVREDAVTRLSYPGSERLGEKTQTCSVFFSSNRSYVARLDGTSASEEKVREYYAAQLEALGWEPVVSAAFWKRDGRTFQLQLNSNFSPPVGLDKGKSLSDHETVIATMLTGQTNFDFSFLTPTPTP